MKWYNIITKVLLNKLRGEKMNIAYKIKNYRRDKDMTQEELAEYLNVSVSAVSQWESGKTLPDISTVLALANFFGVTLDELFDRTSAEKEKDMKEYRELAMKYENSGEIREELKLWREAVRKYPGDYECLINLAYALEFMVYSGVSDEEAEANMRESVAICERILKDCNENDTRNLAIQILVRIYSNKGFSMASEEIAEKYAMMSVGMYGCREMLLENAYFTDESREKKRRLQHFNILEHMDLLTQKMYYGKYGSEEEKIKACRAALDLWQTLIYDGNYQFFHCRIEKIYINLAMSYAKLGKREEAIEALRGAFCHARSYDSLPCGEMHYTSAFVSSATSDKSKHTKNYTCTNTDDVKRFMQNKVFDFIRGDAEFKSLVK